MYFSFAFQTYTFHILPQYNIKMILILTMTQKDNPGNIYIFKMINLLIFLIV